MEKKDKTVQNSEEEKGENGKKKGYLPTILFIALLLYTAALGLATISETFKLGWWGIPPAPYQPPKLTAKELKDLGLDTVPGTGLKEEPKVNEPAAPKDSAIPPAN